MLRYLLGACLFIPALCINTRADAQWGIPLYASAQNNSYSTYTGSYSKSTDQFEHGSLQLSTTGPLSYTVDPEDLTIDVNDSKSWSGSVFPDVSNLPEPGTSVSATLDGVLDITFSHPEEVAIPGTTLSTYQCGAHGCYYHSGVQGTHVITNQVQNLSLPFNIYSINCTIPAMSKLCWQGPSSISATGYPSGGTYQWETSSSNITLQNTSSATVSVLLQGGAPRGLEPIKCTYSIAGASYEATGQVDTRLPQTPTVNRAANSFGASDRTGLGADIGSQYLAQCLQWTYGWTETYDFANAGAIIASDDQISGLMEGWYRDRAKELIQSGALVGTYGEEWDVEWYPLSGQLLYDALGHSHYKPMGTANVSCQPNGTLRVTFNINWMINDEIDWRGFEDQDDWAFFWENLFLDFPLDKLLDCEYFFATTYSEQPTVDFQ